MPAAKVLPFRKRKSVIALDLEGDILRVVQASGSGESARVTRVASTKLEIDPQKREDAAALGHAIKKALAVLKVSARDAVLCLPRWQVVLRPLQVPLVSDVRELASLINFQISKDLPFRIEDAAIDFKVLRLVEVAPTPPVEASETPNDAPAEKRLEVLVGAARADLVQFYHQIAKSAGFKLAALGLRSVAAAYTASRCADSAPEAAFMLLCVRRDETTIELVHEQKLVFSRAAAVMLPPAADAPEQDRKSFLQALEIEVVRSLHSYEGGGPQKPIQKMLIAGGTGLEQAICEQLTQRLKLGSVVLDPASCLDLKRAEPAEAAQAIAPIGLALSALEAGGLPIDFVNPKKPAVQRNTRRNQIMMASAAAMALLLTLFGIRANFVKKRLKIKQELQAQLTDAEKKLPIYRRLKGQGKVINGWIAEDQNWLDHIAYLSAVLPSADQIFVSTFTTTPQHLLRFSVQAKTGELLAELDKKLRAAGYEVRPLSITPANDKNGYNFRTTVELTIPKKMKPDLSKAKPAPRPADDVSTKGSRHS